MNFLRALLLIAAVAALGALVFAGIHAALFLGSAKVVLGQAPALIAAEGDKTRAAALIAIAETRTDVLARVDRLTAVAQQEIQATRTEASAHVVGLANVADSRLAAIQSDANAHGIVVEQLLARELGRAVDGWDQVSTEATATLGESRRMVHDLHPQALGLVAAAKVAAGELASSGREFQRAVPVYIDLGKKIGSDTDLLMVDAGNVAKNLERLTHPHWYDRLFGYGLNGVVMYRNLNPVTNLTVKGAQIIASRP